MIQDQDQAANEALNWLIALQEEAEDEDLTERFEKWLTERAENLQAWREAQHVWRTLGYAGVAVSNPDRVTKRASHWSTPRLRRRKGLAIASLSGAAIICLGLIFLPTITLWASADYATSAAETRDVTLSDGSVVHLAGDSAIAVSFNDSDRRVELLSGEAYFEVQPNKARPFIVISGAVHAKVLGTAFDVSRSGDGTSVVVNHGVVAVTTPRAAADLLSPLQAGDWVRVLPDGAVERGKDDPARAGEWRSGMLVVKDRPVSEVIDVLKRNYKGKIVVVGGALQRQRVTGVYDLTRPLEALHALAETHDGSARQVLPWVVVVSS